MSDQAPEREAAIPFGIVPERPDFDRYLEDTIVIDWQTPTVFEKAKALSEGCANAEETARALFTFVRDEIDHSLDVPTEKVTCNASQVLKEGTGLCYAKSHLLAALLRARGLPAGFCYQRLLGDAASGRYALHGFVAVYLGDLGRWVLLDARGTRHGESDGKNDGNVDAVETEFRVDPPSLAYTPDPEQGEETLPVLLARPAKRVIDLLDYAESLSRIRNHLPDSVY